MEHEYDFSNKSVVITGASAGIGYRTALEFCRRGAFVIGVGRSQGKCTLAKERILQEVPQAKIEFLLADLSSQKEVRLLAGDIQALLSAHKFTALDVLVNNAGTFMDKLTLTDEGIEKTIATNHIAPFLLTSLLLPVLQRSKDGRVLTVSSGSHYNTFIRPENIRKPLVFISLWQYKLSKLCNVLFSLEFNKRYASGSVQAFAVDPGLVNTDIGLKGTGSLSQAIWRWRQKSAVDAIQPATTLLYLAGEPGLNASAAVYWYDCKEMRPSPAALNADLAQRLWQESELLCGLN
ncbi:MAG: SDR family NAD(P)-dependent oxidoreductase [Anaerolineaceae bacterium]|nr:SDR family NAD(P)-dependent oxidoreductase [Anaerolineaceae bacterium]